MTADDEKKAQELAMRMYMESRDLGQKVIRVLAGEQAVIALAALAMAALTILELVGADREYFEQILDGTEELARKHREQLQEEQELH